MAVNWNLLKEVRSMQKNYHLDAYAVDAATWKNRPTRFEITDGCNGKYKICTEHDELFVSKQDLIEAQTLIEQALADIQIN